MQILMFSPNYFPATRYGGPVRSSHGLAKALIVEGHRVEVFTTDVDGPGRLDVPLCERTDFDGVPVTYFPISAPRRLYYAPRMRVSLMQMMSSFDIAHINGIYLWPGPMIARMAQKAGIPFVLSPRGMLVPAMIAGKSSLVKRIWIASQERFTIANSAALHVTSSEEAEGVRRLGVDAGRVRVIGNGVCRPSELPRDEAVEDFWRGIPKGRRVAFLGRLDWTKGVELAIEAVRDHSDAQILIAGPDQIGLRARLEPRLARQNGCSVGRFIGEVNDIRKWALLKGADVLLAPSVTESFGMSVAEALAIGTPVVCTVGVGARTILEELDPPSVVGRTAEAVGAALSRLLDNPNLREDYGRRAAQFMAENYDWRMIARQMAALYRSVGAGS